MAISSDDVKEQMCDEFFFLFYTNSEQCEVFPFS